MRQATEQGKNKTISTGKETIALGAAHMLGS
jgi:hypothetical protein